MAFEHPTILVVEDEPHSREGLRDLLAGRGYLVETAADVSQAISQVNAHRFAGAIIDLHLPPVHEVMVTGWDIADMCRACTPDIAAFLEKPIDPVRLAAALGQLGLKAQACDTP